MEKMKIRREMISLALAVIMTGLISCKTNGTMPGSNMQLAAGG